MHAALVSELRLVSELLFPTSVGAIYVDTPGTSADKKPPKIEGYYPDLFKPSPCVLVGEAKTFTDLNTRHSREQLGAFLRYLSREQRGGLILAVPLFARNYGRTMLKNLAGQASANNVLTLCISNDFARAQRDELATWQDSLLSL